VDDVAILLHHIDLLNARDVVDSQLFQVALQLLVIRGRLVNHLLLSPSRALWKSIKHDVMIPNMVLKSVVLTLTLTFPPIRICSLLASLASFS